MRDDGSDEGLATRHLPLLPAGACTVLAVEDSLVACDALRLMCQRHGLRLRRADSLRAAHRHLQTYRPSAVIVDLGLPDGSGLGLIAELAAMRPRVPVLLATSGDPDQAGAARAAGADDFIAKPIRDLATLQDLFGRRGSDLAAQHALPPAADELALRQDLTRAQALLRDPTDARARHYVTHFLSGVALSAADGGLAEVAQKATDGDQRALARLTMLVQKRLAKVAQI